MKRRLNYDKSPNKNPKRSQELFLTTSGEKKAITFIENLSNELFYEIFEYLDGYHIYQAFFNLNLRFKNLIRHSPLLLKINLSSKCDSVFQHVCDHIITHNRHRIISLSLTQIEKFLDLITLNASFTRLESLFVNCLNNCNLHSFLLQLAALPRLYALTVVVKNDLIIIKDLCLPIFNLPVLKYGNFSLKGKQKLFSHPIAANENFSTIEYLNIELNCTLEILMNILSYTPRLCRLMCRKLSYLGRTIVRIIPRTLSNLTHVAIYDCMVSFKDLETSLEHLSSRLQVLRINTSFSDVAYLDADRWEQLISDHLPHLRTFEFLYRKSDFNFSTFQPYHTLIDRFLSPFWIKRRWLFELVIDTSCKTFKTVYAVHSDKKKWYNLDDTCFKQDSQDIQLTLKSGFFGERYQSYIENLNSTITILHMISFNIDLYICIDILVEIITSLPNLNSLRLSSRSILQSIKLSNQQKELIHSASKKNQITKVNIEQIVKFEQVELLMDLCPQIKYLKIVCTKHINVESLLRSILMKKNMKSILHLRSLCICIPTADDKLIQRLQMMIEDEKFLDEYAIKCVLHRIYLVWK